MYCPRCATQNIESAKFCRACGANLSLVSQALSGRLPEAQPHYAEARSQRRKPNFGLGLTKAAAGFAILLLLASTFTRGTPGLFELWLIIPAFILVGKGFSEIIRARSDERRAISTYPPPPALRTNELSPSFDQLAPRSVTEGTTRRMDAVPGQPIERS